MFPDSGAAKLLTMRVRSVPLLLMAIGCSGKTTGAPLVPFSLSNSVGKVPAAAECSNGPSPPVRHGTGGAILGAIELRDFSFPGNCGDTPALDAERVTHMAVDLCGDTVVLSSLCVKGIEMAVVVKLDPQLSVIWEFNILDEGAAASLALDERGSLVVGLKSSDLNKPAKLLSFDSQGQPLGTTQFVDSDGSTRFLEEPSHLMVSPGGGLLGLVSGRVYTADSRLNWQLSPVSWNDDWGRPLDLEHRGGIGAAVVKQRLQSNADGLVDKVGTSMPTVVDFLSNGGAQVASLSVESGFVYRGNVVVTDDDRVFLALSQETNLTPLVYDRAKDRFAPDPKVDSSVRWYGGTGELGMRKEVARWSAQANVWIDEMLRASDGSLVIAGTVLEGQNRRSLYVAKVDPGAQQAEWESVIPSEQGGPDLGVRAYVSASLKASGDLIVSTTTAQGHPWVAIIEL